MPSETETSDYDQFSLNGNPSVRDCEIGKNLILRKKQKTDLGECMENESIDCLENNGIFSAYDFVYPLSKQICCDSISNHAATLIAQTVEFKLRQIIEEAIKLAFHRGSCSSISQQKNGGLPFISLGDINSAMRYICGSKNLIWNSEKSPRSYFIASRHHENKDHAILETNAEVFHNLPERTIKYIPCLSLSSGNENSTYKFNSSKKDIVNKEIFHKIVKDLDGEIIKRPNIHLHWLAVEGKFVFSSENDTKYIKSIYDNIEINSKILMGETHFNNVGESFDGFNIVVSKAVEGLLSEEQREFLSYMNRIFLRGMEELYSNNSSYNFLNSNNEQRAIVINNLINTYGLSEKDTNILTSIFSVFEGSNTLNLFNQTFNQQTQIFKQSSFTEDNKNFPKELQLKVELLQKLNDIFNIIETNTDFEPILPYLVYYFNYNTEVICYKFEKTGELPKIGSLRLLIRICKSIIRNPYCSKTTYYIHKIIESLIRIMVSCPVKEILSDLNLKVSESFLIENLNARLYASNLLENIIQVCYRHLPIGTAKILEYLSSEFQKLLDVRINNLINANCLQIASLYGIVCGIRSLGDFSVSNIIFPKLLTLFSYYPKDYNSKISFLKLYLEISALINKYINLFQTEFKLFSHNNSIDIICLYWKKLIESLEAILGDGAVPILLSTINKSNSNSDKLNQAICFLDQCIKTHYIDSNIKCRGSKEFYNITNKQLSNQYIKKFIDSYNKNDLVSKCDLSIGNPDSDFYSLKSMLNVFI